MKLIKITINEPFGGSQKSTWVNPDHIERIETDNSGKTEIGLTSGKSLTVATKIEEVKKLLGTDD
jgi:uncharacterized protein YlzI (FlbEa/FlbD family)